MIQRTRKMTATVCIFALLLGILAGCGSQAAKAEKTFSVTVESERAYPDVEFEKEIIQEQVMFDEEGMKITALDITCDESGHRDLKLLFENNSTRDVKVQASHYVINGFTVVNSYSTDVPAGGRTEEDVNILTGTDVQNGILSVGTLQMDLILRDAETREVICEEKSALMETSVVGNMVTEMEDVGTEIFTADGLTVCVSYVQTDGKGLSVAELYFYFENDTKYDLEVICDPFQLNGRNAEDYYSYTIKAGTKARIPLHITSASLEEAKIKKIDKLENIGFSLRFHNEETGEIIAETPVTLLELNK